MLQAMFREIQQALGDRYGLFEEFAPRIFQNEEILARYDNIGVLYITNGDFGSLPDGSKMEISYTLALFMQVKDTYPTSEAVTRDLYKFATGTTGELIVNEEEGKRVSYFINASAPTSDGVIYSGKGDRNYVLFEVGLDVMFTKDIAISDTGKVTVTIGGVGAPLKSVISVVEIPQTQVETVAFVSDYTDTSGTKPYKYDAMENESYVAANNWSIEIVKLFRPNDTVDQQLRELILDHPKEAFTITYQAGDWDTPHTYRVIAHDCTFSNELGQPILTTIRCSTALRVM